MAEFDVFLSHNSKDKPVVRKLAEALKERGLRVWLDEWELIPGRPWQPALEEIIKTANSAAVLTGKDGLGPWEEPEMRAALDEFVRRKSPVIPVLLPDAPEQPELPLFLRGFTWVDFRDEGLMEATLDRLEWGITGQKPRQRTVAQTDNQTDSQTEGAESFEELTSYARHRIAEVASQWLAQECDPFVMPALSRRVTHGESLMLHHAAESWEPQSEDTCRAMVLGQLHQEQNRVRVFSPSGMGKTTILHYCEQQIATADEARVPIRVASLSSYDWKGDVPKTLVDRVLHPFLPAKTVEAIRVDWFRQLIRDHRVVFLLDAVDQTDDQLAGLSQFLQSADVCYCSAILTGRPEVEQTRASVFLEANWETIRVEPFDEPRIRGYLGEMTDKLLPVENEQWKDSSSFERKQHWSALLHVPLLLRLLRRLVAEENGGSARVTLATLHNRHAIYREAVRHLVDQGWASLSQTRHREDLLDHAEVNDYLSEMAWSMVSEENFTSIFQGEPFRRWRRCNREAVRALEQVDLTTRCSLLDSPGELGLAWRHLSFCEYFAGTQLARLDRAEQKRAAQNHGRNPSWQWVFRFALSELAAVGNQVACSALASDLIGFGNPFLVYDAVRGDQLKLPEQLDSLCRWLVHRDWSAQVDYIEAFQSGMQRPELNQDVLGILQTLFDRSYRDSRCLHPAWELLISSNDSVASEIRDRFLAEFQQIAAPSKAGQEVAQPLSLDDHFLPCPPPDRQGETFQIGENAEQSVQIEPFYLGKAPVTNQQFELFDPSHASRRGRYSPDDDSPALYVNWFMAVMFCTWLGERYRLPTEGEWEVACRAGTTTEYWWGDEFDARKCNAERNIGRATQATEDHANDWGFMEMHGNVWEWCADASGSYRVYRAGSWSFDAGYCRSAYRDGFVPEFRDFLLGFRLARSSVKPS